jgi:hypothetical protein
MEEQKFELDFPVIEGCGAVPKVLVQVGRPGERVMVCKMDYFQHGLTFYQFIAACCETQHGLQASENPSDPPVIVLSEVSVEQWTWIRRVEDSALGIAGVLRHLEDVRAYGEACMFLGVAGARDRIEFLFRGRLLWDFAANRYISWDHRVEELKGWQPPMAPAVLKTRLQGECESVMYAVLLAREFGFLEERCGDLVYSMLGNSNQQFMTKKTFSLLLTSCVGLGNASYFCTQVRRSMTLTLGLEDNAGLVGRTNVEFALRLSNNFHMDQFLYDALQAECDKL